MFHSGCCDATQVSFLFSQNSTKWVQASCFIDRQLSMLGTSDFSSRFLLQSKTGAPLFHQQHSQPVLFTCRIWRSVQPQFALAASVSQSASTRRLEWTKPRLLTWSTWRTSLKKRRSADAGNPRTGLTGECSSLHCKQLAHVIQWSHILVMDLTANTTKSATTTWVQSLFPANRSKMLRLQTKLWCRLYLGFSSSV